MLRNDLRFFNKIHASSGIDGPLFWHRCMPNVYLRNGNRERRMASAVKAKWLFGGDDKDMDASIERSEAANEDILIFFFQLDLETRIQVLRAFLLVATVSISFPEVVSCSSLFFV